MQAANGAHGACPDFVQSNRLKNRHHPSNRGSEPLEAEFEGRRRGWKPDGGSLCQEKTMRSSSLTADPGRFADRRGQHVETTKRHRKGGQLPEPDFRLNGRDYWRESSLI